MHATIAFSVWFVFVVAGLVALLWRRLRPTPLHDTGLRVGVVAHVVDDVTVPLIRALGVTAVRVDRDDGGVNDASVARALAEGWEVVVVDMGGDYKPPTTGPQPLLIQRGNEPDAKGVAPNAVPPGVGISSAVSDAWLIAYIRSYNLPGPLPLCLQPYGAPASVAIRNLMERAGRLLSTTRQYALPIWLTEFGVNTKPAHPNYGTPDDLTAALRQSASDPRITRAFVYALEDQTEGYTLLDANRHPNAYYEAVRAFNTRHH